MIFLTINNAIFDQKFQTAKPKFCGSTNPWPRLEPSAQAEAPPWLLSSVYLGRHPEPVEGR
jgi:hypothetical protein